MRCNEKDEPLLALPVFLYMARIFKSDEKKSTPVTASELRKLPKAQRDKILEEQFKLGGKLYSEDPNSILPASHRVHD